jgi:hypothetical protein
MRKGKVNSIRFFLYICIQSIIYICILFFCGGGVRWWWWFALLVCWFVYLWSGLHFFFPCITNGLRLSCFFCCILKTGRGYTFFLRISWKILAYYLHAKTIFSFSIFSFSSCLFFFHFHFHFSWAY